MRIVHQIVALSRALFRSAQVDADLAEEMRFHVERETKANIARGMSPDAARRAARLTFGSIDDAHESSRDERPGAGARQMLQDLRFGAPVRAPLIHRRMDVDDDRHPAVVRCTKDALQPSDLIHIMDVHVGIAKV